MCLFAKPTYETKQLPFRFVQVEGDDEAGVLGIQAYGSVAGQRVYSYACYTLKDPALYDNGGYEQIVEMLKDSVGKTVSVTFKLKKGKVKDFTLDLSSLAAAYGDDRFLGLELLLWGLPDKLL